MSLHVDWQGFCYENFVCFISKHFNTTKVYVHKMKIKQILIIVFKRVLDNPQMLQEMMRSNPMMNQIIEQNPDLAHVFNNPAIIRQAIEMQRNPSMMQVYF